jgi:radical SAM superfamily enzyme YgiQ (UPF0313 family)
MLLNPNIHRTLQKKSRAKSTAQNESLAPPVRVLLVNPPMQAIGAEFMMEDVPLRLEYLAEYIRPDVSAVAVVDLTRDKRPLDFFLRKYDPAWVGITVNYLSTHKNAMDLALVAKRYGARVVVGGYQATALDAQFAAHEGIDVVVRGEGEQTLRELVCNHPYKEIFGITYTTDGEVIKNEDRPLIEDLDTIPPPDRSRRQTPYQLPFTDFEADDNTAYDMIITSRGCWGRCKFCTEPLMSGGHQRYRSPQKVVAELADIVRLHPGKRLRILIADPNFGGDLDITEQLLDGIIAFRESCTADLHFFVSVRTETVANHPRLVEKMARAGIDYVFVGIESPRRKDLIALSKGGGGQVKQEKAIRNLKAHDIAAMSCFLIGIPGQTEEDVLALVDYARSLDLSDAYFAVMTPLPGSELYNEAVAQGTLLETDFTKYRLYDTQIKHDVLSRAKIRELCIRCNTRWYNDLMLMQEHKRWVSNGRKKKKLHVFAGRFRVLVEFLTFISEDAEVKFDDLDPAVFIRDLPNPELRAFTEQNGVHHYLEMRRFLQLLGNQKIQVSVTTDHQRPVSWVLETQNGRVSYVDAITGKVADPSIDINLTVGGEAPNAKKMVWQILKDNRNPRPAFNLLRLTAATSSEVGAAIIDKLLAGLRSRANTFWAAFSPNR